MTINKTDLNLSWSNFEYIVLDLEGTGAQHKEAEGIVEIAAITVEKLHVTNRFYYKLINPEIQIPPLISRIHGLKNKDLLKEPVFENIKSSLFEFINGKILVGHNVSVDYRLLKRKMSNYVPALILDTKKISKHLWGKSQKHGLDDLITKYKISSLLTDLPVSRNRHSAFYDAYATALIFLKMIQENFPEDISLLEIENIAGINLEATNNNQLNLF